MSGEREHYEGDGCGYEHVEVQGLDEPKPRLVAGQRSKRPDLDRQRRGPGHDRQITSPRSDR